MRRVSRAAPHLSVEAVQQKLQSARSYWHRQKWLIVYNGLVDPRPAAEIAKQTGVSVATVHKVISQYNQIGVAALEAELPCTRTDARKISAGLLASANPHPSSSTSNLDESR